MVEGRRKDIVGIGWKNWWGGSVKCLFLDESKRYEVLMRGVDWSEKALP